MAGCYGNHPEDLIRERELHRYLDGLYSYNEEKQNDVIDAVCDDGDEMDAFINWLVDDTHDLRAVILQAVRMTSRATWKRKPKDEAELGRLLFAHVDRELERYARFTVEEQA